MDEYNGKYGDFFQKRAKESVEMFNAEQITVTQGVVRWNSNNSIPPSDLLELWHHAGCEFNYDKTIAIRDEEISASLEEYRKTKRPPSEEELLEMRAAFGRWTKVVDIITGQDLIL